MKLQDIYSVTEMHELAQELFREKRSSTRLDGWFLVREIMKECEEKYAGRAPSEKAAETLREIAGRLPLHISEYALFAGTQEDSFARSYALINPTFRVDSFNGYCDPTGVFNDIEPDEEFTAERIEALRSHVKETPFVKRLGEVYEKAGQYTSEAVFFIEQVTGHVIPDFKPVLKRGARALIKELEEKIAAADSEAKRQTFNAMRVTLEALLLLAKRYASLAAELKMSAVGKRKAALELMEQTLSRVPAEGARNLHEAVQAFILLWQLMCLEQAPNPYAFSAGNADRIFEPYRAMERLDRSSTVAVFKHLLVFYNVGDRSWAISQNLIVGGKSAGGADLTNETTYALLDAYYEMNLPQPILSVKLHRGTPDDLYRTLGRFFFTPGCLTPSLFNDDSLFTVLSKAGIREEDLENYSVAGCQEPLIMGKDNGNTTNSWLNLGKILELTLHNGKSALTGRQIGRRVQELGLEGEQSADALLSNLRTAFYKHASYFIDQMCASANEATEALGLLPVPFLSAFMGGMESGVDMRDTGAQGTPYNGSGCLIHGLSVVADSFIAVDTLRKERPQDAERLLRALETNFEQEEELRQYLRTCRKFGNNQEDVDREAAEIAEKISRMVAERKNYLGNSFRPDWSTPSTHLLYGYWVGATPDGRKAREMLGYGVDPLYGEAHSGMGFRVLSTLKLPFDCMNGGYASHFGIDPGYFTGTTGEEKGMDFKNRIITPLFFTQTGQKTAPFYLYVNVTTPDILRKVLANPEKYAPGGVYIMRIHGTFVNFLDLSPEIQEDIIRRLDLKSTSLL